MHAWDWEAAGLIPGQSNPDTSFRGRHSVVERDLIDKDELERPRGKFLGLNISLVKEQFLLSIRWSGKGNSRLWLARSLNAAVAHFADSSESLRILIIQIKLNRDVRLPPCSSCKSTSGWNTHPPVPAVNLSCSPKKTKKKDLKIKIKNFSIPCQPAASCGSDFGSRRKRAWHWPWEQQIS